MIDARCARRLAALAVSRSRLLGSRGARRAMSTIPTCGAARALAFPRDEGAHPAFRSEWWYVTGLAARRARRATSASRSRSFAIGPALPKRATSRFAPKQLLFAHAAIADPDRQRLRHRPARRARRLRSRAASAADDRRADRRLVARAGRRPLRRTHPGARRSRSTSRSRRARRCCCRATPASAARGPTPRDASFYYSRPQLARERHRCRSASARAR